MNTFLEILKKFYKPGKPIFIEDILLIFPRLSRSYVFKLLKRAEAEGKIIRFSRGVYCFPKQSIFGETVITSSMVANDKYVSDGKTIYGIYSGLSLLNQFAISSQIPNTLEIITNNEATRKRTIKIDGKKYIIRKSRFKIDKDNYAYYTLLQLFSEIEENTKLDNLSKQRINSYIKKNKIEQKKLINLAMVFPAKTIKKLIGSEILSVAL